MYNKASKECVLKKSTEDQRMNSPGSSSVAGNRACGCVRKENVYGIGKKVESQTKPSINDCADFCGGKPYGKVSYMV